MIYEENNAIIDDANMYANLAEFARWVIQESAFAGCSLDGGEVQDKALELGLMVETTYNPMTHGMGSNYDVVEGNQWFVLSPLLNR